MGTNSLEVFAAEMLEISGKPAGQQAQAIKKAIIKQPKEIQEVISQAIESTVPPPDAKTSNTIWLIVIWCFGIVMVLSAIVLSVSVFNSPEEGGTKSETILTVFMTVTAFLAGLFAPSPVPKNENG